MIIININPAAKKPVIDEANIIKDQITDSEHRPSLLLNV